MAGIRQIKYTGKSGLLDVRVPDVGMHFDKDEVKPCTDEQAELLLRNSDFEEVTGSPSKSDATAAEPDESKKFSF